MSAYDAQGGPTPPRAVQIVGVAGIGEITAGDDLAAEIVDHLVAGPHEATSTHRAGLRDGDVVVVTSKVVSKAAGLLQRAPRGELLDDQTDRIVARRGPTRIVRTHHGLTMAAAGIDASNVPVGTAAVLPADPDGQARRLRADLGRLSGTRVAVVVSDTAGRAWRTGQTDIAIGAAGLLPSVSLAGTQDPYGNPLAVTAPAVADEIAAAADLVTGKLSGCPVAIVRGIDPALLTADDGPGAAELIRDEDSDLFGLGAVEAVRVALRRELPVRGFPSPEPDALDRLIQDATSVADDRVSDDRVHVEVIGENLLQVRVTENATADDWVRAGALAERLRVLAVALAVPLTVEVEPRTSPGGDGVAVESVEPSSRGGEPHRTLLDPRATGDT